MDEHNYQTTSTSKAALETEAAREQIDRLLASNTFHASDVLRRLLRFLADKTFSGEATELISISDNEMYSRFDLHNRNTYL